MRLKLISCEVLAREMTTVLTRTPNQVELELLSMGLHEIGCEGMRERLQDAIDRADVGGFDAVLLGYGLCNNGLVGLQARSVPLVTPRAHDCITLLLGNKQRYFEYFHNHPGVYFRSSGWLDQRNHTEEFNQLSIARQNGLHQSREELIAKYGEDNGQFLFETLGSQTQTRHYLQLTFIEMGVEPDNGFEKQAESEAHQRGWRFEKISGDLSLIQRMVDGYWDDGEFLVVPPGEAILPAHDERIISTTETSA